MQFTLTTDYAIRTVFYLAKEKQIRNAETLAVNLGIPLSYVPKVTSLLKKAGIIDAMEGVQGGYYLIKDPLKIALWDIISVTENTVQINRCLEKDHFCSRYAVETCPVRKVYKNIQEEFKDRFKNISISELASNKRVRHGIYLANILVDIKSGICHCLYVQDAALKIEISSAGQYRDFVERYTEKFVHPDDRVSLKNFLLEELDYGSLLKKSSWQKEFCFRRKNNDDYMWMDVIVFGTYVHGTPEFLITLHNATHAQKELEFLSKALEEKKKEASESFWKVICLFQSLLDGLSTESKAHNENVKNYTMQILDQMIILYPEILLPKQERISISKFTALHDIGKLAIPKDILNKPGALDEREWEIMKTHTLRGAEIVGQFPVLQENPEWSKIISDICKYHHERIDGKVIRMV